MARAYGRFFSSAWEVDEDWLQLTQSAKYTYLLLLSQQKLSLVGVLDYLPSRWGRLAPDTNAADIEAAVMELEASRFVLVDRRTDELLIRTFVKHDVQGTRSNPKLIKGFWRAWETVSSRQLRQVIVEHTPDLLWSHEASQPPAEARHMRAELGLSPTDSVNRTGESNHQTEPLNGLSLLPPPSSLPAAASSSDSRPPGESRAAAAQPSELFDEGPPAADLDDESPAGTPDQRESRLLAQRSVELNPTRGPSPERHLRAVARGKLRDHRAKGFAELASRPTLSGRALAAVLEPPPAATDLGQWRQHRPAGIDADYQRAQARRLEEDTARLRRQMAEPTEIATDPTLLVGARAALSEATKSKVGDGRRHR
jgi:hypothetical protein